MTDEIEPEADSVEIPEVIADEDTERANWSKRRLAVISAIRLHYETHGSHDWKLVKDNYPDVGTRMFWRLVAKVKVGVPDTEILASTIAFAKSAAKRVIPAAPSPAIIYSNPKETRESIDFMHHMHDILLDINKLRDFSLGKADADGKRDIKNPMYFSQAVKLRMEALDRALKAYDTVWDLRKQMDFYDAIISEVAAADPETSKRIMERLNLLNNERGLTIDARPGGSTAPA